MSDHLCPTSHRLGGHGIEVVLLIVVASPLIAQGLRPELCFVCRIILTFNRQRDTHLTRRELPPIRRHHNLHVGSHHEDLRGLRDVDQFALTTST